MKDLDIPIPLPDLLAELATESKPASAWEDELKRKASNGQFAFLYLDGRKGGRRYSTRRCIRAYLAKHYKAPNTNTADAVREALNGRR